MKILAMFILKVFKQIYYSIRAAHYVAIFTSLAMNALFLKFSKVDIRVEYLSILNTVGILSTFFVFAIEKIDFYRLITKYPKMVRAGMIVGRDKKVSQGDQMTNTFFSFVIVDVLLLGVQYVLYLFGIIEPMLLFFSIVYMVLGFIMIVGTWHGSEIHKV